MKILVIHNDYQKAGGEQIAVNAQIDLLKINGNDVSVFIKDNNEINSYTVFQKIAMVPQAIYSQPIYKTILTKVADERPDIVHVHNVFPLISPAVYQALWDAEVPTVQTIHNFRFLCPNGLFYTHGRVCELCKYGNTIHSIVWRCYRNSYLNSALYATSIGINRWLRTFQRIDRYIALTEFTAKKLIESRLTGPDKISVLGNFLPGEFPAPGSFTQREPYILYLGRLSPEKGIKTLIQAVSEGNDLMLKIAGDGPQIEELKTLVTIHGVRNVEFIGDIRGDIKWNILRNATATISPSVCYETFSYSTLESLSVGTPVIASDIGSLPYLVRDHENGLLFPPGDPNELRKRIMWVANHRDEALRWGENGYHWVRERYSAERHYQALIGIYTEVIKQKSKVI